MSMQVQACKDKPSTLVNVFTVTITHKKMTDFDASITNMNLTDWLLTLIIDKKDRPWSFNHRDKLDRTVQIGHGTGTCTACMNAIYSKHVWYIKVLASLGLHNPRECVKFNQPYMYLSEKVTCSFYCIQWIRAKVTLHIFKSWKGSLKALNFLIITP